MSDKWHCQGLLLETVDPGLLLETVDPEYTYVMSCICCAVRKDELSFSLSSVLAGCL